MNNMKELLQNGEKVQHTPRKLKTEFQPLFDEKAYCEMVEKAKHYIREGDIFQVVLSNRLEAEMEGSLLDAYRVLRTTNPSPYMFYFSGSDGEIINELEDNKRGIYGGAIGYISFTGNLDTCIAIRLAFSKNGKVFVRSGAGIVADSVPEKEYRECIQKAATVRQALQKAQEGMEA